LPAPTFVEAVSAVIVARTAPRFFPFANPYEEDLDVGLLPPDQVIGHRVGAEIISETDWLLIEGSYGHQLPPVVRQRIGFSIHRFRFWAGLESMPETVAILKSRVIALRECAVSVGSLLMPGLVEKCDELLSSLNDRDKHIWPGQLWQTWVCFIKVVLKRAGLPVGIRNDDAADKPASPIVRLIWELQQFIPASHRKGAGPDAALAKAIRRALRDTIPRKK
jgi:hypothetical protein